MLSPPAHSVPLSLIRAQVYNFGQFYPYVFTVNATYVAHGRKPSLVNTVSTTAADLAIITLALNGGGWNGYYWQDSAGGEKYLKIALISEAVELFGQRYFVSTGFRHVQDTRESGPHCAPCRNAFNLPCAFRNTLSLLSHAYTMLLMSDLHSWRAAFDLLTASEEYGGGGSSGRMGLTSDDWLCARAHRHPPCS